MSTSTTAARSTAPGLVKTGALTGLAAGVVNVVLFFVAKAAGVPFEVAMGGSTQAMLFAQPLVLSFVALLLGALLLKALARSPRGVTIWTAIAVIVFVAYTAFAFGAATTTSTALVLTAMHVVVLVAALVRVVPVARRTVGG
ncbi:DUF6069 family protein [Kineosporia sp. A_224]|uniref:DUF6069 family protein n=1 Tax=Kineosporia sp. A_224 TaxID=1962180 RepID=UPI000B4BE055|nr:DUF6069 family protein [Kineosporia sp. A_224]